MILQQLRRDAEALVGDLPPSMYDRKAVKWVVHLDGKGRCQGIEPLSGGGKKDRGKLLLVPFRTRTVAIQPLPFADKVTYTWGVPDPEKVTQNKDRSGEEHAAYLEMLERCAAETENADVATVAAFVRAWDPARDPLPEGIGPADLTTFAVEGRYPMDLPVVRAFWGRQARGDDEGGTPGQCLVCGRQTRVVERLPVVLKGVPHGQPSGIAIVSANASAFESYGRSAALTSSVCLDCGERFGKAANVLLQNPKRRLVVGPVAYLFWTSKSDFDYVDFLNNPDPEQVKNLLLSAHTARPPAPVDMEPFYAAALSAAMSRAVVRGWMETTIGAARANLIRWFALQRMVDGTGAPGAPLSIFKLAVSLYRESKDIVAWVPETLTRSALYGSPLPVSLLQLAVRRNQADQGITYPRAALIKAVFCSLGKEDPDTMAGLNPNHASPAYHCGRLLAELEGIQRQAIRGIKATLVDRYYTGASAAPARVFGQLLNDAQSHLGKLRKENPGAYSRLSQALEGILGSLDEFPRTLTVQNQALFSLGYYHQRGADRAAARAAAEAKQAAATAGAATHETDEEEEN